MFWFVLNRFTPKEENSLVQWASSRLHDNKSLDEMVEPALRKTIPPKALSRFADIVSMCTQVGILLYCSEITVNVKGDMLLMTDIHDNDRVRRD